MMVMLLAISVGMTPWKGQEKLLDAFVPYSKINRNAYLLLIGSPVFDNDKYYKKIKSKNIKKSFRK